MSTSSQSSDGLSSVIEDEPLSSITWVVILDSGSELVSSDVLSHDEGSVS